MTSVKVLNINQISFELLQQSFAPLLPEEVVRKAERYHHPQDRLRNLAGEVLSRYALFLATGTFPKGVFHCSEHGKPYLENSKLFFNVSHSGIYVAAAVSEDHVGIDIEKLRRNKLQVARRFFSEEEIALLQTSETPDKDFSRLWSLKEAYLKYMGSGLTETLNSFTVRKGKGAGAYTVFTSREQAAKVNLYHKRWDENYFLSICYGLNEKVTCIELLEIEKLLNFAKHYEE